MLVSSLTKYLLRFLLDSGDYFSFYGFVFVLNKVYLRCILPSVL